MLNIISTIAILAAAPQATVAMLDGWKRLEKSGSSICYISTYKAYSADKISETRQLNIVRDGSKYYYQEIVNGNEKIYCHNDIYMFTLVKKNDLWAITHLEQNSSLNKHSDELLAMYFEVIYANCRIKPISTLNEQIVNGELAISGITNKDGLLSSNAVSNDSSNSSIKYSGSMYFDAKNYFSLRKYTFINSSWNNKKRGVVYALERVIELRDAAIFGIKYPSKITTNIYWGSKSYDAKMPGNRIVIDIQDVFSYSKDKVPYGFTLAEFGLKEPSFTNPQETTVPWFLYFSAAGILVLISATVLTMRRRRKSVSNM